MKISKSAIRSIIKESVRTVAEQVVGYEAPKASGDDDEDGGSDESGKDWVQTGTLSGAADDDTSLDQRVATSTRQTSQQRQQDLDKGDAVAADEDGEELQGLVNKQTEAKIVIRKNMLLAMIRESLLLEQDSIIIDYLKEEVANSDDPEPGVISREDLTARADGAGYKGDEVEKAIDALLEDGDVIEEDGILTLQKQ